VNRDLKLHGAVVIAAALLKLYVEIGISPGSSAPFFVA
jgi:hypothetical protein